MLLHKFFKDWAMAETSRVQTAFSLIHISGLALTPHYPIKLILNHKNTNLLCKFCKNWDKNVTIKEQTFLCNCPSVLNTDLKC